MTDLYNVCRPRPKVSFIKFAVFVQYWQVTQRIPALCALDLFYPGGQLSLAIPPWVNAMSNSRSVSGDSARCTSPAAVLQCKLVSALLRAKETGISVVHGLVA